MCLYLTKYASLFGVASAKSNTITQSLQYILPPNIMAQLCTRNYIEVCERDVTVQTNNCACAVHVLLSFGGSSKMQTNMLVFVRVV